MKELRITVRFTQEDYELLKQCAELDRRTITDFVRSSTLNYAEQFINNQNKEINNENNSKK